MPHRMLLPAALVAACVATAPALAAPDVATSAKSSTAAAPATDGWPATPAGEIGREWVAAFGRGDAAMRAFYEKRLSPAKLKEKSAEERLARYRPLHEQMGALTLGAVVKSAPAELEVTLLDADAKPHRFTFTTEPGASPARLEKVTMTETRPGGHGGLGSFFHH